MYTELSKKQVVLSIWRDIPYYKDCETLIATGAIRTGKTEIGSKGFHKEAMKLVRSTPRDYRTKGYNLYAVVSSTKSLALLNIIEPIIISLELKGYSECRTVKQFYKASKNVFVHTTHPMGMVQVKDYKGNITRYLYLGADNKRALNKVTGLTLRGWFLDEAPLLGGVEEDNIAFIERMYERTATFRTEPYGRPLQIMTTNPQTGEDGEFYKRYIQGGWSKGILVLSFTLLDNPIFSQKDVDYYERIFTKAQFLRKVMGRWVRDNSVATYPKFDYTRHVKPHSEVLAMKFVEMRIGLDEGQRDARSFVLAGFTPNYEKIAYIDEYYYKNDPNKKIKDINDYIADFWEKAQEWYETFKKPMVLEYDSAALYIVEPLKRYKAEHRITIPVIIKPVYKGLEDKGKAKGKNSAIKERMGFTNILLGSDNVIYSDKCKVLADATSKCINKDGMRVDNGKTNKVDILDASEYAVKKRLKLMQDRIMYKGAMNGQN